MLPTGNSLGKALFYCSMTLPHAVHKGWFMKTLVGWVCCVRTWLAHTALTSTPSNTLGMNCNGDCGLFVQHQCLSSQIFYCMNCQNSHRNTPKSCGQSSGSYSFKEETNSTIMFMIGLNDYDKNHDCQKFPWNWNCDYNYHNLHWMMF